MTDHGHSICQRMVGQCGHAPAARKGDEQAPNDLPPLRPRRGGKVAKPAYQPIEIGLHRTQAIGSDSPRGLVENGVVERKLRNTQRTEAHMSMPHSEETHQSLLARIPKATGRDLSAWLGCLDEGPGLLRFDERVNWLRDEHALPHGYARAIVHEHDLRRAAARG